jgi:hypothetical protein
VASEEKRDGNTEVTEIRTQRAQRPAKRKEEMKEGFIARKACDAKPFLSPLTPLGMTGWGFVRGPQRLKPRWGGGGSGMAEAMP